MKTENTELEKFNKKLKYVYIDSNGGEFGVYLKGRENDCLDGTETFEDCKLVALKEDDFFRIRKIEEEFSKTLPVELNHGECLSDTLVNSALDDNYKEVLKSITMMFKFFDKHWKKHYEKYPNNH